MFGRISLVKIRNLVGKGYYINLCFGIFKGNSNFLDLLKLCIKGTICLHWSASTPIEKEYLFYRVNIYMNLETVVENSTISPPPRNYGITQTMSFRLLGQIRLLSVASVLVGFE